MTDSDIINALEYFTNKACEKCKVKSIDVCAYCVGKLWADAINAIKRQQAEIERLTVEKDNLIRNYKECALEAVKDFAWRLKAEALPRCEWVCDDFILVDVDNIDKIVAEMEEKA